MMTMPLEITEGARRLLETDPHGWILCLVSVSVVFGCLLILCAIYSLSGAIFSGRFKRVKRAPEDAAVAAAIAMALECESGEEVPAAIALALSLETEGKLAFEDNIITFRPSERGWNDRKLLFRQSPGNERI